MQLANSGPVLCASGPVKLAPGALQIGLLLLLDLSAIWQQCIYVCMCISLAEMSDFAGFSHKLNTLIGCHHVVQDLMATSLFLARLLLTYSSVLLICLR